MSGTFYTSVTRNQNHILLCGYHEGQRFIDRVKYQPYVFLATNNPDTPYKNLKGEPVEKKTFETMGKARDFYRMYENVTNFEIYGMDKFVYPFIRDTYPGDIDYDATQIKTWIIDIETASAEGFPNVATADQEITAISIQIGKQMITLGCGDFFTHDKSVTYVRFKTEKAMLKGLIGLFSSDDYRPDVITGWYIRFFDIPYIVNRLNRVLGPEATSKISPWGLVKEKIVKIAYKKGAPAKEQQTYEIAGVSILDYQELYKKFTYNQQESYTLDHIAWVETGKRKLDISEYESLHDLYLGNYQKYVEYNIEDVRRVSDIDDKMKLLELAYAIAYDAKVNLEDSMTSVRLWDVIIHNYLMERNTVVPQLRKKTDGRRIPGGYVKEPQIGMHNWVVSFDLTSLYPHLIKQYNISPETFLGKKRVPMDGEVVSDLGAHMAKMEVHLGNARQQNMSMAANGCLYRKDKQGFMPALMKLQFDLRVKYKKQMQAYEKQIVDIEAELARRKIPYDK